MGSDYTQNFNGWRINLAVIGYTNPDQDYFSKGEGVAGKQWRLSEDMTLNVSAGFRYAWDRREENILDDPIDNNVNVGATLRVNALAVNLRRLFDIFPNSTGNQLRASVSIDVSNQLAVSAYFIPQQNIENFGITGEYQFAGKGIFKRLIVQWNRSVFDFGNDAFGNELKEANEQFRMALGSLIIKEKLGISDEETDG
mgnify:CR=1 FL=1